jgi:hypothetical protein
MKQAFIGWVAAVWLAAAASGRGQGFVSARGTQIVGGTGKPLLLRGINFAGESGENDNGWIRQFRETFEANSVGWCFWPYKKVEAESCVMKIKRPAGYEELVRFADAPRATFEEIRKAREGSPRAAAALRALPEASRFSANEPNRGYIEALGMKAPN